MDSVTLEAGGVVDVAYGPGQTLLYAAMRNGDVNVYDLATGQKVATWHVGTVLGGISVSEDGSFLLVVERQPAANSATFYRVDTTTGAALTVTTPGSAFRDVEIVDGDTALLTGGNAGTQTLYDFQTGTFSPLANSVHYSGWGSVLVEDGHLTLVAEPGISNGPLFLFDDRTDSIVARGDNYQTIGATGGGGYTGFNYGSQAVNEAAGLVLQFIYYSNVLIYDLDLKYLRHVPVAGQVDGMVFDPTGRYVYVYEIESGYLAKYEVATWTKVDQFEVGTSTWHNDIGYGSQLLINADGTRITIVDSDADIGKLRVVDLSGQRFDGTAGADSLAGGSGDDIYLVNHSGDVVTELPQQGDDTVETALPFYTLGANLERLTGLSASAQILQGNSAANAINGGGGDDSLRGHDGDDRLFGNGGTDVLRGGRGVDGFDGGGQDDVPVAATGYGDRVSFYEQWATQGAVADLRTGIIANDGFGNSETMAGIESLGGDTAFADTFNGNDGRNSLLGAFGDYLYGHGGQDHVYLSGAPALADGGDGSDRLVLWHDGGPLVPDGDGDGLAEPLDAMTIGWEADIGSGQVRDGHGHEGSLQGFEDVRGSDLGDLIFGNGGANVLEGGGGDDSLFGREGADSLEGGDGNDLLDGGAGADHLAGGLGDDVYFLDSGDTVGEAAGAGTDEIRSSLASISLAAHANVENLTGTSATGQIMTGSSAGNVVNAGSGNDVLHLWAGGDDTANGGAGNDNLFFGATLTSADVVNGGAGVDTLVVQGPYGSLTLSSDVTQIENLSILGGNNTNFGEPGTNRYDYVLTTHNSNFAAGVQARINGSALLEGEDFTFDGSAETDASYVVYGGKGKDTLTGGLGNDIFFYAEERFASGDTVNGGAGYDGMFLRGNYTIDFNAPGYTGLFTNIENLTLTSATDERYARGGGTEFDYNLTLSNAIVNAGQTLTVSGALLMATETMILDASQETNGFLRLFGGAAADTLQGGALADLIHGAMGADTLRGGGGADVFRYQAVTESYSVARDHIADFTPGTDKIDLSAIDSNRSLGGDQAFSWIGSNAFSNVAGQLRAFQSGAQWIVQGDINGDGFADLVIALTLQGPTPLGAGDFLL